MVLLAFATFVLVLMMRGHISASTLQRLPKFGDNSFQNGANNSSISSPPSPPSEHISDSDLPAIQPPPPSEQKLEQSDTNSPLNPTPPQPEHTAENNVEVNPLPPPSEHESKNSSSPDLSSPQSEPSPVNDPPPREEHAESPEEPKPITPVYKTERPPAIPIVDNFPLAAAAHSADDLPPIPPWNRPPKPHVPENTPLFIGFSRNWNLLQQTVVSWITAGWPPEDIYVVENTGTMRSNELGHLSLQNPFYLNHTRLHMYGVNIIVTPTLFTFAQLQNFYLWTAIQRDWPTYFWGHMDVIALSFEDRYASSHPEITGPISSTIYEGYKSIYNLAVSTLRSANSTDPDPNAHDPSKPWAIRFFAYDRLALVNRAAFEAVGGWDTAIPYYHSDCDMHDRLTMYGFDHNHHDGDKNLEDVKVGYVKDISNSLDDLLVLYRKQGTAEARFTKYQNQEKRQVYSPAPRSNSEWVSDFPGSPSFQQLLKTAEEMEEFKNHGPRGRNTWQTRQSGGKGEPYYRDPEGFEIALGRMMNMGSEIYAEKWGYRWCGLVEQGRKAGDEWRVEHDW